MDYLNARSMELLRRLELATPLREVGVAPTFSTDFVWTDTLAEPPVLVWHQPSVDQIRREYAAINDGTAPVEPYQRVEGSQLERLARDALRRHPLIDLREGCTLTDLCQGPDEVTATVVDLASRTRLSIRTRYLVACDGGRSTVRRRLEIALDDAGEPTAFCSVYFRSADPVLRQHGRAFLTIGAKGVNLVSRDEGQVWSASVPIPADSPPPTDPIALVQERLGQLFTVDEVMSVASWEGTLAVAASYRMGAVFLAGDAAHQFYPAGGHGANTGIGDAVDLGWKLAGVVNGWGGPALLDSYEQERRPVALINRELCADLVGVTRRFSRLTAAGASREQRAGILEQEVHQIDSLGVHFGHRYGGSPIICHEDGEAPLWQWRQITASTWPGGRAPSLRLDGGVQLFDRFGSGYTLVDLSGRSAGEPLVKEAHRRGVPMTYLAVDDDAVRSCWERELVLVRPDHYVAWRDDCAPVDWDRILDRVCGGAEPIPGTT
jgi:2-polyprenyl-6-methoxyphenol hydroxylase-like FAD-dependent oxidoreductase